jgi:hypothetical protein
VDALGRMETAVGPSLHHLKVKIELLELSACQPSRGQRGK